MARGILQNRRDLREVPGVDLHFGNAPAQEKCDADNQRDRTQSQSGKCSGSTHNNESAFRRFEGVSLLEVMTVQLTSPRNRP
jgi:hypothetical protein